MRRDRYRVIAALGALLLLSAWGDPPNEPPDDPPATQAVIIPKAMSFPPGADPSVPAELGGNGFEAIASADGWQSGSLRPEEYRYMADTNAKKGGELRWGELDYPETLRPYGMGSGTTLIQTIYSLVYESLLTTNPLNLDFLPYLASHWKVDPDEQTYYFRIDPNARFSDGYPVTSEDVVATCRLLRDSTLLDPAYTSLIESYDPPVPLSKYIVKVHSREKKWKGLLFFSRLPILPAHVIGSMSGEEFIRRFNYNLPPGSGPYVILSRDVKRQRSVALSRIGDWWQRGHPLNVGRYNFNKLKMFTVEDDNLRYEKYRNGEHNFYYERRAQWWITKFDYDNIKTGREQKRRIYTDNPQGIQGFAFNMRRAPFDDAKVREAFICLFNREELIEKLMYNQYPICDSYFSNSVYENKNNPKYRYNAQRGAMLLDEAGYNSRNSDGIRMKNGKPLILEFPVTKGSEHLMGPIEQELLRAGIKMNIHNVNYPELTQLMDKRDFDLVYLAYEGEVYPNPRNRFGSELADLPNTNNITGIKNAQLDSLIALEEATFDQSKRVVILQQIDSILMASKAYALGWNAPFQRVVYWNHLHHPEFYLSRTGDWSTALGLWWSDPDNPETKPGPSEVTFWKEWHTRGGDRAR